MNTGVVRPKLDPWNRRKVLNESVTHAVLLLAVWFGGLGYLGLVLLMSAELVLVCALSIFIFPERGIGRHLRDIVSLAGVTGFLLVFVFVTSGAVVRVDGQEPLQAATDAVLDLPPGVLKWALLASGAHLAGLAMQARLAPRPRMAWTQVAIVNAGVTVIWLFVLIFAVLLLGVPLIAITRAIAPGAPTDAGLVLLAVAIRLGIALFVSRMPAKDLEAIADNPYVD